MSQTGIFWTGRAVISYKKRTLAHLWANLFLRSAVSFSQMNCNCARSHKSILSNAAMTDPRPEHSMPTKIVGPVVKKRRKAAHEAAKGLARWQSRAAVLCAGPAELGWRWSQHHGQRWRYRGPLPCTMPTFLELGRLVVPTIIFS